MRDIMKPQGGTHSGTGVSPHEMVNFSHNYEAGERYVQILYGNSLERPKEVQR